MRKRPGTRIQGDDALRIVTAEYLRAMRRLTIDDVRHAQQPPWASLTFGAAGVAYAYWRAASRGRSRCLEQARRWVDESTLAATGDVEAFVTPHYDASIAERRRSLATGPDGLRFVSLLVRHSAGEHRRFARELAAFEALALRRSRRPAEFIRGTAAYLLAARTLHTSTGAAPARLLADALADTLCASPSRTRQHWTRMERLGFARGRAGVFFALLDWSAAFGRPLPRWFFPELDRLASVDGGAALRAQSSTPWLRRSWCNGSAGMTLLWLKAFEQTRQERYLDVARRAAKSSADLVRKGPVDLCCGLAGRAYACLAMHRLEPDRGWHERAVELAVEAVSRFESPWQHGLLRGYPGVVCLALDLLTETPSGFPLVEA